MIVEDSRTYNNTISSLLRSLGYEIVQAYNFKESLKLVNSQEFDYIILDLILPDGEGDDLIFELKGISSAKIIVLSGAKDIQRRNYLFEQGGVIDYFSKDMPLRVLINDLDNLIQNVHSNSNFNVLIVDDSSFVRRTVKSALESKNYNVLTSQDPIDALGVLMREKVDLIFSDLEMPKMSGIEFLEKIKASKRFENIPVLILSSSDNREDYARVLKHGAVDFIKKPFILEEIILKCDLHIKQSTFVSQIASQAKELDEYKRILDESDIISKANHKGLITYVNKKFSQISGYKEEELIGKPHSMVRHPDVPKEVFKNMWETISSKKTFKGVIKNRKKDGSPYYVDATIAPILDLDGNIKEYIGVRHDVTGIMSPKKQFLDDIQNSTTPIAILMKIVNYEMLKEFYGESFLQVVEDHLSTTLLKFLPEDSHIKRIYRLDNGLFGLLRENHEELKPEMIEMFLLSFKENIIAHEFIINDNKVDIDFYFSYTTQKKNTYENIHIGIKKARREKIDVLFSNNLAKNNESKFKSNQKIINILKDAISLKDNKKVVSYYQPIYNNKTKEIEKYESLVRVINSDGTVISPYHFIDIAKKAGYYKDITNIVIENTKEALAKTDKEISINLSTIDIEDLSIRNKLLDIFTVPEYHGRVVFELLEDEVAKDFKVVQDFIALAKVLGGVKIAIDDFGSGYSNFERLVDFQPDILKIDGSLIKNIVNDEFSQNVVEAIVLFAKKENIQTVAEFISDEQIFEFVKNMDIDYCQGYHLGKPATLEEYSAL